MDTEKPSKLIAISQERHQNRVRIYISVEVFSEIISSISVLSSKACLLPSDYFTLSLTHLLFQR